MKPRDISIGRLAKETGSKVQTIRYYEDIGLLPAPPRTAGNHRVYDERHVRRLSFIRHSRELGFSLDAIREMLTLSDLPDRPCETVDRIAQIHLDEVMEKIARLTSLKTELERMISRCKGGRISECRIIEVLADHSHAHCLTDHGRPRTASQ